MLPSEIRVGDLVKEKEYPEVGLVVEINHHDSWRFCRIVELGRSEVFPGHWFDRKFIVEQCEVVSRAK